jgi:hypothetical protein
VQRCILRVSKWIPLLQKLRAVDVQFSLNLNPNNSWVRMEYRQDDNLGSHCRGSALAADAVGYPVVVKISSETITHKTDVRRVKLKYTLLSNYMRLHSMPPFYHWINSNTFSTSQSVQSVQRRRGALFTFDVLNPSPFPFSQVRVNHGLAILVIIWTECLNGSGLTHQFFNPLPRVHIHIL